MTCINLLPPKVVERRIWKFVNNRMDPGSFEDFLIHVMDCAHCGLETLSMIKLNHIRARYVDKLIYKCFQSGSWEWVLELGAKMERLGYEKVYPNQTIVKIANARLA